MVAVEIAGEEDDWAFVNVNVRPYYAEGSKTLGFEIAEQLGWRLPEQVVVPVASGAQLVKVDKGLRERMAAANREKVNEFAPDRVARQYVLALEDIVSTDRASSR